MTSVTSHLILLFCVSSILNSCVTTPTQTEAPLPVLTLEEATHKIPAHIKDRGGWAEDILAAIVATQKEPTAERVCAVIAVIEQESGFQQNPVVADLPKIVHDGLLKKLSRLGPLAEPALAALLTGKAPKSQVSFAKRIDALRTERDLDRLFRDIAAAYQKKLPGTFVIASALSWLMDKGELEDLNPVTTIGSMQVKVAFSRSVFDSSLDDKDLRELLYTRAGGIRAGTARLIGYSASYDDVIYRFADYNSGMYSSRNAEFQAMLSNLTKAHLSLDGDLLAYESNGNVKDIETHSLQAILQFAQDHNIWNWTAQRDSKKEKDESFEDTTIWKTVRSEWQQKMNREPLYARIPDVSISSPKLQRLRSTTWFASSVKKRYEACRAR